MKFLRPNPVPSYSAYLLGPLLLWSFMQAALFDGSVSILANARLVRKVYFPRAILPLSTLLGNGFHFAISFAFTIAFLFVARTYPEQIRIEILLVIPIVACAFCLCLGVNYVLSYLNVLYEDVRFIVQAVTGIFFYVLPLLYPIEDVARRLGAGSWEFKLYMANPVAGLLVCYQRALLGPPEVLDARGRALPPLDWPVLWPYLGWAALCSIGALSEDSRSSTATNGRSPSSCERRNRRVIAREVLSLALYLALALWWSLAPGGAIRNAYRRRTRADSDWRQPAVRVELRPRGARLGEWPERARKPRFVLPALGLARAAHHAVAPLKPGRARSLGGPRNFAARPLQHAPARHADLNAGARASCAATSCGGRRLGARRARGSSARARPWGQSRRRVSRGTGTCWRGAICRSACSP
jgi:ABC-type polysaccharide/polyol phosphate export permease